MSFERTYTAILRDHFERNRQMAFVSGPRQVGKTWVCRTLSGFYFNWDNLDDRRLLLKGPAAMAEQLGLNRLHSEPPTATLDEIHKGAKWKSMLKGFFDTYGEQVRLLITGSSRLDVFRRGGDSLMGRYLHYRMHPFSVGECLRPTLPTQELHAPELLAESEWQALWEYGGFPEPFIRRDVRFSRRWRSLRQAQLSREDLREVTSVRDLGVIELLMRLLAERSGEQVIYSNLANDLQTSTDTIKRWIDLLERMHYGFLIRPWFTNVTKGLRKEPKWFLRDWSGIANPVQRSETFVGCHLLKAVDMWTDLGLGDFELRYLRDTQKREVDFLVVKDQKPWFLVEVKHAETALSPSLAHFQQQIGAPHAFQAVVQLPYEPVDCFTVNRPVVVPARTLLSQLV